MNESSANITIHQSWGSSWDVTFEGQRAQISGTHLVTPEGMRMRADANEQHAQEELYRARRLRALAAVVEQQQTEEAARKAQQRKERSARTRAHKRDPFGFLTITSYKLDEL